MEGEELQPSSCPGSNTAFGRRIQFTLSADAIVTLFPKKLNILAVLQVTLGKAVKSHASAAKMSYTSHFKRLSSISHTLIPKLLCFLNV